VLFIIFNRVCAHSGQSLQYTPLPMNNIILLYKI
jgi:hypothetical protein